MNVSHETSTGIWVTGPSRTGTSMAAGLLDAHGVFFGKCVPADRHNERGYFEHPEIVRRVETGTVNNWPRSWWEALEADGWDGKAPWGLKRGPQAWPWVRFLRPSLIVICRRPLEQVIRSRTRRWPEKRNAAKVTRRAYELLDQIAGEASCPVFWLETDLLVKGDFSPALPIFEHLGMEFSAEVAEQWIDPRLWNRGPLR